MSKKYRYISHILPAAAAVFLGLAAVGCQAVSPQAKTKTSAEENMTETSSEVSTTEAVPTTEPSGGPGETKEDAPDSVELSDETFSFDSFVSYEGELYARVYIQLLSEEIKQAPGAGIFTIYQDRVYYVNGSPVSGEESQLSFELHRCRLDGGGDETIARDAVLSTGIQPAIVGDRLIYAYGVGGVQTGLAVSTLDGRKRTEYKLGDLDIIGFDASYVYYQKSGGGEKKGVEIWALNPDTQERIRLVSAPNRDEAGGLGRVRVIDGAVYAWSLLEPPKEQESRRYSLRAWELRDGEVMEIQYPEVISEGNDFALIGDEIYYTDDRMITRCRLDGNGKSTEPEVLAQLSEESYGAEKYLAAGEWLYYTQAEPINEETKSDMSLCRVPLAGGEIEKVCIWYVP